MCNFIKFNGGKIMKVVARNDDDSVPIESSISDQDFYILRLYVAGQTRKTLEAFANLKKICTEHLGGRYSIRGYRSPGEPSTS